MQGLLSFDGTMHPKNVAEISSPTGGQITNKKIQIGEWVDKNQTLIEIDKRRLLLTKKLNDNQLKLATEYLRVATKTFARVREMYSDSLMSEEEFDKSKYEHVAAQARYSAALTDFEVAQLNLSDSYVRAPFAGQIAAVHVGLGETVMPGTPLLRLAATDTVIIRATVNAGDIASLRLNQHARIFWAQGALSFPAKIHAFTTVSDPTNHRYSLELMSPNPPKPIVYGTLVRVDLTVQDSLTGVLVNSRALRSFDGQNFSYKIKRIDNQYQLQKTPVTVLRELNNGIFLIGEGLDPTEQIAAGGALMTDGLQIRIGNSLIVEP
jgi:RND family efflux transporter MFP subunit